jgi:hypothetical protein
MKKIKYSLLFSFFLVAILVTVTVFAQNGLNGSGWWSWIQVQRVGESEGDASVNMVAYAPQGDPDPNSPWDCGSRTLSEFGVTDTFFPHWDTDPNGDNCADQPTFPSPFQGSSVLSANDAIVAVAQTRNISYGGWAPGDTPYGRASSAYNGIGIPSTSLKFPVYKNDHNGEITTFFIQNAGGGPADITAVFKPCADNGQGSPCLGYPNVYTYTVSGVESNKMVVIDATLAEDSENNPMPAGSNSFGGLTITSTNDQPLAGVIQEHHKDASPAIYLKSTKGFGTGDVDTRLFAPTIKYQYPGGTGATLPNQAKWSGLVVHNADDVLVTVNITYTLTQRNNDPNHPDVGTNYYHGPTPLDPGESAFFLFHDYLNPPTGTQPGDLLTAEIDATGDIVAIVNEEGTWSIGGHDLDKDLSTYATMPANSASNNVAMPIYKDVYKDEFSGVVIQNTSDVASTITATLFIVDSEHAGASKNQTLRIGSEAPGGGSLVFFMICQNYNTLWYDLGGDDLQMADLCSVGDPPWEPPLGVNTGMIIESDQPIFAMGQDELLWYVSSGDAGDGAGIDASSYEGIPILP